MLWISAAEGGLLALLELGCVSSAPSRLLRAGLCTGDEGDGVDGSRTSLITEAVRNPLDVFVGVEAARVLTTAGAEIFAAS